MLLVDMKILFIFFTLFLISNGEICYPWPENEFVTGTVSNYVADNCCGLGDCSTSNRAFYLQGLSGPYNVAGTQGSLLGWDPTYSNTFVYNPNQNTIAISGRVIGTNINTPGFGTTPVNVAFLVSFNFQDVVPCILSGTPLSELKQESACYGQDVNGAEITSFCWYCSATWSGTFTAVQNSPWYPAVIPINGNMVAEFGFGASGGDANLGLSAWITLNVPTNPHQLPPNGYTITPGGTNDLDCNINCNTVCSITILYSPQQCSSRCKNIIVFTGNDNAKTKTKEYVVCNDECITITEPGGTSVWLHVYDHDKDYKDCYNVETIFKINDICHPQNCVSDPNNELQIIENSSRCGLPCPKNVLGPQ